MDAHRTGGRIENMRPIFEYLDYRDLLKDNSNSKYRNAALFASGEYYFMIADYEDARKYFTSYIETNPRPNSKLFALMYLWKISKMKNEDAATQELEKQIMTFEKQSFVFRDFKERTFESPLDRDYKAVFSIDKVAFYVEGGLFEEISY
jgi:tetratricopeptide (TPR) repeat protein